MCDDDDDDDYLACMQRIVDHHNKVVITDRMWARVLSSTNQPSFLGPKEVLEFQKVEEQRAMELMEGENYQSNITSTSGNN